MQKGETPKPHWNFSALSFHYEICGHFVILRMLFANIKIVILCIYKQDKYLFHTSITFSNLKNK